MRQPDNQSALHFEQLADSTECDRLAVSIDRNSANISLGATPVNETWA
jgi:hypothetical protein